MQDNLLELTNRIRNIEKHLFGISKEDAEPLYRQMNEIRQSLNYPLQQEYYEANKELFVKLDRILGHDR